MRLYRTLLRVCFPAAFRRRFGDDMAAVFEDRRRAARARGPLAALIFWGRAIADLTGHGIAERRAAHRTGRRTPVMHAVAQDVRFALRSFRQRPGFTAAALVTLALGIGANTAIFSVVHAVMLRGLPYPHADRIVLVYATHRRYHFDHGVLNPFAYTYVETRNRSFASMSAMRGGSTTLTGAGDPVRLRTVDAMPSFFDVMDVRPALGRLFTPAEARDGARVVVISHHLWANRLGRRPDVVGRTVVLDGQVSTIVGVMPASFVYPEGVDFWRPMALTPAERADMHSWYLAAVGRLNPGVTLASAQEELNRLGAELEAAYPEPRRDRGFNVVGLQQDLASRSAAGLTLLQGVVLFVLLIACANVANLLLAQVGARRRELGVRAAVGGSRWRLMRQMLTESLVLAAGGAAGGTVLALWGVKALVAMAPSRLLPYPESIGVSWAVLGVTAVAATLTGLLFGLMPALFAASPNLADALRDGERAAAGGLTWSRRQWLRATLVAGEVAVALVLLTGAGLLMRSFERLLEQAPGFRPDHLLTAWVTLPAARYPDASAQYRFWSQLTDRLGRLPGVTGAAGSTALPFSPMEWQTNFVIKGREEVPNDGAGVRTVTPDFFTTLGIPLLAGRSFTRTDTASSQPVMIVSDAFARQHLAGLDPIGQQVSLGGPDPQFATIVGVVGATRHLGLDEPLRPEIYQPLAQDPNRGTLQVAMRTTRAPLELAGAVRRVVGDLDPNLPVQALKPMAALIDAHVAERRFYMTLLTLFAALATVLAATGIFGLVSYIVSQGRREIGIRLAFGARPAQVRAAVLRQGLTLCGIGAVAGLAAARALSGLLTDDLFETAPTDVMTYALAALAMMAVAVTACWVATSRASSVDPVDVLRA